VHLLVKLLRRANVRFKRILQILFAVLFIKLIVFKPTTMGILCSVFSSSKEYNLEDRGHADRAMFDEYVGSDDKFTHLQDMVMAITGTSVGSLGFYLAEIAIKRTPRFSCCSTETKVLLLLNRDSSSAC
jgi:hypothetical protein